MFFFGKLSQVLSSFLQEVNNKMKEEKEIQTMVFDLNCSVDKFICIRTHTHT